MMAYNSPSYRVSSPRAVFFPSDFLTMSTINITTFHNTRQEELTQNTQKMAETTLTLTLTTTTMSTPPAPSPMPTYKIVLLGRGQTGKTTFVRRLLTGEYSGSYIATLGVEVHPYRFYVKGKDSVSKPICFNVWDTAGQEKFGGLRDGYYIQADAAVVFLDTQGSLDKRSDQLTTHVRELVRVTGNIPVFVVSSLPPNKEEEKVTTPRTQPSTNMVNIVGHAFVSSRCCSNLTTPFLELTKVLLLNSNLRLGESPPIKPPVVNVNRLELYKRTLEVKRGEFLEAAQVYAGALMEVGRQEEANRVMELVPLEDEF